MPALIRWINHHPETYKELADNGLQLLWITPLRALAKDLEQAMQKVVYDLKIPWQVKRRTGDVSSYQKQQLKKLMPEVLITTPESMHIMMAQRGYPRYFEHLNCVVIDEWHELLGSKRGTQAELALSRLRGMKDDLQVWGISATIGNMQQAKEVLLGPENGTEDTSGELNFIYKQSSTTFVAAPLCAQTDEFIRHIERISSRAIGKSRNMVNPKTTLITANVEKKD
jgi:ATP-dependent Lhr-like helicase